MGDAKHAACAAAMSGQAVSRGPAPCGKSKGFSEGRPALPYCMCMHQHSARRRAEFAGRAGPRGDAGTAAPGWEKRSGTDANSRRRNRRKPMRKPYQCRPPSWCEYTRTPGALMIRKFAVYIVLNIMTQGPAGLGLFICRPRGVGERGRSGRCVVHKSI